MATDASFARFVCDQMALAGDIVSRKMFGEYAVYCGGKVVAFVCDNQLFVKPTAGGRALLGTPTEAPPYPGGKPWFLIADGLDDREALARLISTTAQELPAARPAPARKTAKKSAAGRSR